MYKEARNIEMTATYWMLIFIGILMSAAGSFFLKVGAVQIHYTSDYFEVARQVVFNWKIFLGVMMYFIPVLIWIFLLKKVELSFLQPLFSLVYVVTPILASVFLHESVSSARWLGIGVIMVGVIIVART